MQKKNRKRLVIRGCRSAGVRDKFRVFFIIVLIISLSLSMVITPFMRPAFASGTQDETLTVTEPSVAADTEIPDTVPETETENDRAEDETENNIEISADFHATAEFIKPSENDEADVRVFLETGDDVLTDYFAVISVTPGSTANTEDPLFGVKAELPGDDDIIRTVRVVSLDGEMQEYENTAEDPEEVVFETDTPGRYALISFLYPAAKETAGKAEVTLLTDDGTIGSIEDVDAEEGLDVIRAYHAGENARVIVKTETAETGRKKAAFKKAKAVTAAEETYALYKVEDGRLTDIIYDDISAKNETLEMESGDFAMVCDTGCRRLSFDLDGASISGMMPKDASVSAEDVTDSFSRDDFGGKEVLTAYDVTIISDGMEYQPGEERPVTVQIKNSRITDGVQVWHILDDGTKEQLTDIETTDGRVTFTAEHFSIYAVVDGPELNEKDAEKAVTIDDLTDDRAENGFYMTLGRTNQTYYVTDTLNNNNALIESLNDTDAAVWHFEPSGDTDTFYIYTETGGQKQYIRRKSGNLIELGSTGTPFTMKRTSGNTFQAKVKGQNLWLQHSNGGNGIRLYNSNTDAANTRFTFAYVTPEEVENDPYKLDGVTYGLLNYSDRLTAAALMPQAGAAGTLAAQEMTVRTNPLDRENNIYIAQDSDIAMWTFHSAGGKLYKISVQDGNETKYLKLENGSLTLTDEQDATPLTFTPGTGSREDSFTLTSGDSAVTYSGSVFAASVSNGQLSQYLHFAQLSDLTEDDFVVCSAEKVSVSDKEKVKNGSRVIIYTRVWDPDEKKYRFYALDHDGTMIPCYESGNTIKWVGTRLNTLLWNFTEYYFEGTDTPNNYYELKNPYSGKYIAPQIRDGQIFSDEPIGINLTGRRYGDYYSSILAWDDPYYSYAGLKVEDGRIVSCPYSEVGDFYFAIMQDTPETNELHPIDTLNNDDYGITMKMVNFSEVGKYDGTNTTKEQHEVIGNSTGGMNIPAHTGLLSTDLKNDGFPQAELTGKSLAELFGEAQTVNHLFTSSVYNASGYFEFDSTQNFASLQRNGDFRVYQELGTTDNSSRNSLKHGQFFPYNDINPEVQSSVNDQNLYNALMQPLDDTDPRKYEQMYLVSKPDYYFGMQIEAQFVQTPNGHDNWGHDIIYEFTGDDDFWLYVDGELVIDLGGIHSALPGKVNYCTGEVVVEGRQTTLYEIFQNNYLGRGMTEAQANTKLEELFELNDNGQYVFKDYTTHNMKIFFMERGAGASNLHMHFNLSSVKPGQVILNKKISGTENKDYKFAEYAYQIYYQTEEDGEFHLLEKEMLNNHYNVTYQNTNIPAKYLPSYTPAGAGTTYDDVFFLTPGRSLAITVPEDTFSYYIKECGVNTQVYDEVRCNDELLTGTDTTDAERKDFAIPPAKIADRKRVVYDNHVKENAKRTLTITKKLFDAEGHPVTDDVTGFDFRLYLGDENTDTPETAAIQDYCVKNPAGEYCRWDAAGETFVTTGKSDYNALTAEEKTAVTFQTSFNGSISKIPAEYKIEVRELLVGTKFRVIEQDGSIPVGYKLLGYKREGNSYITTDGSDNNGIIRENESPAIEVHNQRGIGLTAKKIWSDADYTASHGDIFTAVYVDGDMLSGTIRKISHPGLETYYYFDSLLPDKTLADYQIREVEISGTWHEEDDGTITPGLLSTVRCLDDGDSIRVTAEDQKNGLTAETDYTVSYVTGSPEGPAHNARTDTITNTRYGVRIIKQDVSGSPLSGSVFTLKDENDEAVGAASYTSAANGLVTTACVNMDTDYKLTETICPYGYYATEETIVFHIDSSDGQLYVTGGNDECTVIQAQGDAMPAIIVHNRPAVFTAVNESVDDDDNIAPLPGSHFALYREITVDGETGIGYKPIMGYESLSSQDITGLIERISMELPAGGYYLRQTDCPAGYVKITEPVRFTIDRMGRVELDAQTDPENAVLDKAVTGQAVTYTMHVYNRKLPMQTIRIKKVDEKGNLVRSETAFAITGDGVDMELTTENGYSPDRELPYGTYTLSETVTPAGYHELKTPVTVTVAADGVSVSGRNTEVSEDNGIYILEITNVRKITPPTGFNWEDSGKYSILLFAICAAGLIFVHRYRKSR